MKCGVVIFPGSNCDFDTHHVLKNVYGRDTVFLWHKDHSLHNCDLVILPGGFSYGDYLRSGAIARFSPLMQELQEFADRGG
ncbi:MAG: phosphoribosylformylglycinamidine synthase subunit PurQ, partial [Acidobacteria bacterium]|nr:phosphoribosylformylglycinamidine synthase subunit PurQ [Acidobacteriota bacterium]